MVRYCRHVWSLTRLFWKRLKICIFNPVGINLAFNLIWTAKIGLEFIILRMIWHLTWYIFSLKKFIKSSPFVHLFLKIVLIYRLIIIRPPKFQSCGFLPIFICAKDYMNLDLWPRFGKEVILMWFTVKRNICHGLFHIHYIK